MQNSTMQFHVTVNSNSNHMYMIHLNKNLIQFKKKIVLVKNQTVDL